MLYHLHHITLHYLLTYLCYISKGGIRILFYFIMFSKLIFHFCWFWKWNLLISSDDIFFRNKRFSSHDMYPMNPERVRVSNHMFSGHIYSTLHQKLNLQPSSLSICVPSRKTSHHHHHLFCPSLPHYRDPWCSGWPVCRAAWWLSKCSTRIRLTKMKPWLDSCTSCLTAAY